MGKTDVDAVDDLIRYPNVDEVHRRRGLKIKAEPGKLSRFQLR